MRMWNLGKEVRVQAISNVVSIANSSNSEGVTAETQINGSGRAKNFITNVSCYHSLDGVGQKGEVRAMKLDKPCAADRM